MNFDRYVGLPWVQGGRDFDGCDCWGLVCLFWRHERGIVLPTFAYASTQAGEVAGVVARAMPSFAPVESGAALPGDIAVIRRGGEPSHVGILAPRQRLLHVESAAAPSVLEPITAGLSRRVEGIFRPDPKAGA